MTELGEIKEEFKEIFPDAVNKLKKGNESASVLWYGFKAGYKTAKGENFEREEI